MKSLEIVGFERKELGAKSANKLRSEGYVPCVLYGGEAPVHFYVPMILFRDLVYTPEVHQVNLNVQGKEYVAILQDLQVHPVNEVLLHADFLLLRKDVKVKMSVPVKFTGSSVGVQKGGRLDAKLRHIKVKATPENLPDEIVVDITNLDLGKTVKVSAIKAENFEILVNPLVSVATISIPRALRQAQQG